MGRPSVSFQKRRREIEKREKRRDKEAKREARKRHKATSDSDGPPVEVLDPADVGLPQLDFIRSEENRLPDDLYEELKPDEETTPSY